MLSPVRLSVTPWTITHQVPLPMEFSRQEYWRGCHFLLQGIFPIHGSNSCLLHLLHWQVGSLPLSHLGSPRESTEVANIGNNHHLQVGNKGRRGDHWDLEAWRGSLVKRGLSMQLSWCWFPIQGTRRLVLGEKKVGSWYQLLLEHPAATEATVIRTESIHQVSSPSACLPVSSQ